MANGLGLPPVLFAIGRVGIGATVGGGVVGSLAKGLGLPPVLFAIGRVGIGGVAGPDAGFVSGFVSGLASRFLFSPFINSMARTAHSSAAFREP
jgi:hypothetical protein